MRVSPGEEPKSNWEKRRLLVGLRSGRWPCHLRVVAQVVITTLLVVGILKMHEMWILFKVANAVGRAAASQGDRLSQDAISKEMLNLVRRMLSSQLSSEDLRASLSILSTPSAPSTCARWDVYDAQLERCFIMDPGVVLWFGGDVLKSPLSRQSPPLYGYGFKRYDLGFLAQLANSIRPTNL